MQDATLDVDKLFWHWCMFEKITRNATSSDTMLLGNVVTVVQLDTLLARLPLHS